MASSKMLDTGHGYGTENTSTGKIKLNLPKPCMVLSLNTLDEPCSRLLQHSDTIHITFASFSKARKYTTFSPDLERGNVEDFGSCSGNPVLSVQLAR